MADLNTLIRLLAIFLLSTFSLQAQTLFKANLSGHSEVFPTETTATGELTATLDGLELTVTGSFSGLSSPLATNVAGGAHLHTGYAGQTGGIMIGLTVTPEAGDTSGTFEAADNTFTLTAEQAQAIQERRVYVNVHSTMFPSGEIRGQLLADAEAYYATNLFGSNEVPSVLSSGHGALALELTDTVLTVSGSFADLGSAFNAAVAGGAHLHMALPGSNGGIQIPLVATPDADLLGGVFEADANTFSITADQAAALADYRMYANIHTVAHGSGEIRGQVVDNSLMVLRAHLSGSNESVAVTTLAGGDVQAAILNDSTVAVYGSFSGLESEINTAIAGGAHVHLGMAGMNGGIVFPLTIDADADLLGGTFRPEDNTFTFSSGQLDTLIARGFYVNIHTVTNPSGELRGQLVPESQIVFTGFLSSIFEVPSALSTGGGQVKAELRGSTLTVSGAFSGLNSPVATQIAGGAHLHLGMAGAAGPIAFPLSLQLTGDSTSGFFAAADNSFVLSDGQVDTLRARGFYANIHTLENTSGELRSQLLGEASTYFVAPLSGASETSPVNTGARGMAVMEVRTNSSLLSGSFSDLSSALNVAIAGGVHIHDGLAGRNGPIVNPINTLISEDSLGGVFSTAANSLAFTPGFIDSLRARRYYLNVHSINNPGGELRGQFLPLSTAYFTSSLRGQNEVQPVMTAALGGLKLELHGSQLALSGSFAGLSGAFNENIAGGSHLHIALPGQNGGIDITLTAELAADTLSGSYLAADNTYDLTPDQLATLLSGQYYANIHTTVFAGGELRSQVLPEINFFPSGEADIVSPADGALVTIEGDSATAFTAAWNAASDRDTLAYIWQLSTEADFSNIVLETNVGNNQTFTTDFGTVDALLESIGLLVGETDTLYHRALASDGNVATPGQPASVILTRGMVTAIHDPLAGELDILVFPTIATEELNIRINSERGARLLASLVNSQGQLLEQFQLQLSPGENNEQMMVNGLPAGLYYLRMVIEDRLVATRRFIKRN